MREPSSVWPSISAPQDLLNRRIRDVRLSVTDRCNFRCSYCMPAEVFGPSYAFLPRAELLNYEEIALVAASLVQLGARTLRVTGGEPLVRRNLGSLIAILRSLDDTADLNGERLDLAMTTNGSLLKDLAASLRIAGLDRVTVSLDSLKEDTFAKMSGSALPLRNVLEGIAAASAAGFKGIKLNAVVRRGFNEGEIPALVEFARTRGHTLRLIEYMDVGTANGWHLEEVVPASEMIQRIDAVHPIEPISASRPGEVANRYRYRDGAGEVGIIASVTAPFCKDCTRVRVTADGRLYTCLFAATGSDLRPFLRPHPSPAGLLRALRGIWEGRSDRYSEMRDAETPHRFPKVEMFRVGG